MINIIKNYYKDCLLIMLFMFLSFIAAISKSNHILLALLLIIIILILFFKNEDEIIKIQCYFLIASIFILDFLWLFTSIDVPLSLRFYVELINIVLFVKIIKNKWKYSDILKDPVISVAIAMIILNFVRLIDSEYNLYNLFLGIRSYFRWILVYICMSKIELKFLNIKKTMSFIFFIQATLIILQSITYKSRDQIDGTFGLYGTHYLLCFISIIFYYLLYSKKQKKVFLILNILIIMFMIIMGEIKIAFILFPVSIIFVYILLSKERIYKKGIILVLIVGMLVSGSSFLGKVYPEFTSFFTAEKIISYIDFRNPVYEYSRFESLEIINTQDLFSGLKKTVGMGMGFATSADFHTYEISYSKGRIIKQMRPSEYYLNNEKNGYHVVSFNTFLLENGFLGVFVLFVLIIRFLLKSINIYYNSKSDNYKAISLTYISFLITFVMIFFYSDIFYNIQTSLLLAIFSGYINNIYNDRLT